MKKKQTRVEGAAWKRYPTRSMSDALDRAKFLEGAAWQRRECVRAVKELAEKEKDRYIRAKRRGDETQQSIGVHNYLTANDAIAAIKRSGKGE